MNHPTANPADTAATDTNQADTPSGSDGCRCNRDHDGIHPCHWGGYTCTRPGTQRFYAKPTGSYSIAGAQTKVVAHDTWACDDHWAAFKDGQ
jgi:hypothetical protein